MSSNVIYTSLASLRPVQRVLVEAAEGLGEGRGRSR